MADAEGWEDGHIEAGGIGAEGEDCSVVAEVPHIGGAESPGFAVEIVCGAKSACQSVPATYHGD